MSSTKAPSSGASTSARDGAPKHDTLPSATPVPTSKSRSATPKNGPENAPANHRKDTVALIDEASSGRELSTGLSVLIIVVFALVAGAATYLWRSAKAPDGASDADESAETSADSDPAKDDADE